MDGSQYVPPSDLAPGAQLDRDDAAARDAMVSLCVAPERLQSLSTSARLVYANWVDFILTTANTWKRPIEDFTLIVERTDPKDVVSFCWNGPVAKLDAAHFQAHAINLIPGKELRIGFYHLEKPE